MKNKSIADEIRESMQIRTLIFYEKQFEGRTSTLFVSFYS